MKRLSISKRTIALFAFPLVLALLWGSGHVFQTVNAQDVAAQDDKGAKKKRRRKPKGRLPAYYRTVVTPEQREKIYTIQEQYTDQIEDLQDQIADLKDKQKAEIVAVLTPEQKKKIDEIAAEAKAKREKAAEERKKAAEERKKKAAESKETESK